MNSASIMCKFWDATKGTKSSNTWRCLNYKPFHAEYAGIASGFCLGRIGALNGTSRLYQIEKGGAREGKQLQKLQRELALLQLASDFPCLK